MMMTLLLVTLLGATDRFGVPEVLPTAPGGREWSLPDAADTSDGEWVPDTADVGLVTEAGVTYWHTCGDDASEVRLNVMSPSGKAWWRNIEATIYIRRHGHQNTPDQLSHVELVARSERHSTTNFPPSQFNGGAPAPAGTATMPGYPFTGLPKVNAHCAGSSYHANLYDGWVAFEKEVTHVGGYSGQRGKVLVPGLSLDRWVGAKFILYNTASSVHLELWLDLVDGAGFSKVASYDDVGDWTAVGLDGCGSAPYLYTPGMLIAWAGPQAIFRSDSMGMDFTWATIREIAPPTETKAP